MQNIKAKGLSVQKIKWKQMDRRMEAIALLPMLIWSVTTIKSVTTLNQQWKPCQGVVRE